MRELRIFLSYIAKQVLFVFRSQSKTMTENINIMHTAHTNLENRHNI